MPPDRIAYTAGALEVSECRVTFLILRTVIASLVDPLTFRHVPSMTRRMMRAHPSELFFFDLALLPFFNEGIDQDRKI
jgi:hypothetical protein